jgi:urease accessory protein
MDTICMFRRDVDIIEIKCNCPPNGQHRGASRVGIGGPVGSGKTRLLEQLIPRFKARGIELAVITNDLATREDAERVRRSGLIDPERVRAVETGACPHTAIREDPTLNISAAEELEKQFAFLDLLLIESGGDNLASTFSLELVDYWLFVIDVAGGGDIARKRGPGILSCDLLIINKYDLAPYVGVDVHKMKKEAEEARGGMPVLLTNCATGEGVDEVAELISCSVLFKA